MLLLSKLAILCERMEDWTVFAACGTLIPTWTRPLVPAKYEALVRRHTKSGLIIELPLTFFDHPCECLVESLSRKFYKLVTINCFIHTLLTRAALTYIQYNALYRKRVRNPEVLA